MKTFDIFLKFSGIKPNKSKCEITGLGTLKSGYVSTLWDGIYWSNIQCN